MTRLTASSISRRSSALRAASSARRAMLPSPQPPFLGGETILTTFHPVIPRALENRIEDSIQGSPDA
jgi:hypothetical protein